MPDVKYLHAETSGLELILTTSRAKRHYPWHLHVDHWTIGLVLSGSALIGVRPSFALPRQRVLREGESFVVRPHEVHSLTISPKSSVAVLCLDAASPRTGARTFLRATHDALAPRHAARLARLATTIAAHPATAGTPPDQCTAAAAARAIIPRLVGNSGEPLSISEMAALAGFSRWHFLRSFRAETGMTPHAYQLACRVSCARRLLRKNATVADAAATTGFTDQSHFHKHFKQHHGLTPRQFLRNNIKLVPQ